MCKGMHSNSCQLLNTTRDLVIKCPVFELLRRLFRLLLPLLTSKQKVSGLHQVKYAKLFKILLYTLHQYSILIENTRSIKYTGNGYSAKLCISCTYQICPTF